VTILYSKQDFLFGSIYCWVSWSAGMLDRVTRGILGLGSDRQSDEAKIGVWASISS
jgi:hypothetical protein